MPPSCPETDQCSCWRVVQLHDTAITLVFVPVCRVGASFPVLTEIKIFLDGYCLGHWLQDKSYLPQQGFLLKAKYPGM